MKVIFINPACLDQRVTDQDAQVVPIGLYYLAAQLMDMGIPAPILNLAHTGGPRPDAQGSPPDPLALFRATIQKEQPDIIGFSVTNPSRINAIACARIARECLPQALILFGGPAPTFMADHLFKACPELDVVVKGEGEIPVVRLAAAVQNHLADNIPGPDASCDRLPQALNKIPGLVFRQGDKLVDTGPAPVVENLDTLVHPSKYFAYQHLAMSRGCPGKCTFCGSPKFWGASGVRRHSPAWIFTEIQTLARSGVSHFFMSDDTFTMDREAVLALCDKIIDAGLAITWNAISRVDYIDAELLKAMRRAGCIQISFGVESGSPQIRKTLGKPIDDETTVWAFSLAKSYGILPRAYFIYGSPGETSETIDESIALMERLAPLGTVFYMLVLFPGTHLYARALKKGWVDKDIWFRDIEDIPWFELDPGLDFERVKGFGDRLRQAFFSRLHRFVREIDLVPDKEMAPYHADFLSRLALTFSHGEYADHPRIKDPEHIAAALFERALTFARDPRAYLGLGMIFQKNKQFPEAVARVEQGLKYFPGHKDLCVCMGVCLMNLGEFDKALSFFTPFDSDPGLGHYINICKQQK